MLGAKWCRSRIASSILLFVVLVGSLSPLSWLSTASAFSVEVEILGRAARPFPITTPLIACGPPFYGKEFKLPLNTGVGPFGTPMPAGNQYVDKRWSLSSWPLAFASPAYSLGKNPRSDWVAGVEASWINPIAPSDAEGPKGYYDYVTGFVIPTNSHDVQINMRYAADNSILWFYDDTLNMQSVIVTSASNPAFGAWIYYSGNIPDVTKGTVFLHGHVYNNPQGPSPFPLPNDWTATGLIVEGNITGKCHYA